jgi:shikimate dehydrogenase
MDIKKLYGLIGYPLGHSFSKQFFLEKFEREGLHQCSFELFPIASIDEFPALLAANPALKGVAVTIPYKEKVLSLVHTLSNEVQQIGAANCITIQNGLLTAYNTDIIGFKESFTPLLLPHHNQALVLGTGGAAKAAQYVLKQLGIPFTVVSRSAATGLITYDNITATLMQQHAIIINCSPAGMYPNEAGFPQIPYEYITKAHYLYDMVYRPAETVFLRKGKERGATIKNGYEMLELQALANWQLWNNEYPIEAV